MFYILIKLSNYLWRFENKKTELCIWFQLFNNYYRYQTLKDPVRTKEWNRQIILYWKAYKAHNIRGRCTVATTTGIFVSHLLGLFFLISSYFCLFRYCHRIIMPSTKLYMLLLYYVFFMTLVCFYVYLCAIICLKCVLIIL